MKISTKVRAGRDCGGE